ncbi:MAG: hypothetical protein ABI155_01515 [Paralcaligenes sp.]
MDVLSLSMLAVFLLLFGAVMTGLIAEYLPKCVIECSSEGRFATFGEDHATRNNERGVVSTIPSPSAI